MNTTNRRTLLAAAAALGATAAASAQPRNEPVIGDKGATISARATRNGSCRTPTSCGRRLPITARCRTCGFRLQTRI
ncbi:twin-arginine translocation signal domain-containing protein [Bradyrhizobium jicamae]|uniref:Twin-arginine translocation signal domain-containing protein n=1 Tax=Bradyrhizobium jicamae TaxID=280332 RepID=A0ABS5FSX6_9BRAD|nr:twin-arginine translocation signal domain-containing protein [Bradyrhizobium jicamae]MBR0799840.1 twin-arginine translocation signal domain-containing protein [Bradyrhizobium jicamae]MBR0935800.1 twin-arginine translocation signal domain-containing protein [Bradyrhizobium jicamae]